MQENHYSRILVATDGSTSSIHATDYAISIALKNSSQLFVLYVIDAYEYSRLSSSIVLAPTFGSEKYLEEKNEAEKLMNKIKEKFRLKVKDNIKFKEPKTEIVEGVKSVATTIMEYAKSENIDLIIIGSRGRTSFKKLLLGSISSNVMKNAHCAVLVIR
ncbi:MAG TPA: universal stress protein [Nitrososphaeraceae archaeon]|nr:universal stress protein [Nitrososphaeraceae archaeon]